MALVIFFQSFLFSTRDKIYQSTCKFNDSFLCHLYYVTQFIQEILSHDYYIFKNSTKSNFNIFYSDFLIFHVSTVLNCSVKHFYDEYFLICQIIATSESCQLVSVDLCSFKVWFSWFLWQLFFFFFFWWGGCIFGIGATVLQNSGSHFKYSGQSTYSNQTWLVWALPVGCAPNERSASRALAVLLCSAWLWDSDSSPKTFPTEGPIKPLASLIMAPSSPTSPPHCTEGDWEWGQRAATWQHMRGELPRGARCHWVVSAEGLNSKAEHCQEPCAICICWLQTTPVYQLTALEVRSSSSMPWAPGSGRVSHGQRGGLPRLHFASGRLAQWATSKLIWAAVRSRSPRFSGGGPHSWPGSRPALLSAFTAAS